MDRDNPKTLLGCITLEDTLKARVRHLEEEQRREGMFPLSLVLPRWLRMIPQAASKGTERDECTVVEMAARLTVAGGRRNTTAERPAMATASKAR